MIEYTVKVDNELTRWYLNGQLHRAEGPAKEWLDGSKEWYVKGNLHRADGPAVEYASGYKYWYLDGKSLTEKEFNNQTNSCEGRIVEIDGKKYKLVSQ